MCDTATILRNGRDVAHLDLEGVAESELVTAMLGEELADEADAGRGRGRPAVVLHGRLAERSASFSSCANVSLRDKLQRCLPRVAPKERSSVSQLSKARARTTSSRCCPAITARRKATMLINGQAAERRDSPYDAIRQRRCATCPRIASRHSCRHAIGAGQPRQPPLQPGRARWFRLWRRTRPTRVNSAVDRLDIDVRAASQVQRLSGRKPAEGDDRQMAGRRFRHAPVLRPDPGHRHPDEGTDLRPAARTRRRADPPCSSTRASFREIPIVCDRVLVMYGGRIVHEQPAATATEEALLTAAHGLVEAPA